MFGTKKITQKLSKRAKALRERMDAQHRCDLARDIGATLDQENVNDQERKIALEIIEKLVIDETISVRKAIAEAVAGSPHLPGPIARKLAEDIEEVSLPVLKLSPCLEEQFLEDVINSGVTEKITAIAGRSDLSAQLCQCIVSSGRKKAVVRMLKNPTANISDISMTNVVRIYGDDKNVEDAIFERGALPEKVINVLRELTEAHVKTFIQRYFNLPEHMIDVDKGRELLDKKDEDRREGNWWDDKKGAV